MSQINVEWAEKQHLNYLIQVIDSVNSDNEASKKQISASTIAKNMI